MAKGRKLTTSRSELFLGNSGYNYQVQGAANAAAELGEEDVWSAADDTVDGDDHSGYGTFSSRASSQSNGSFSSSYRSHRQASRADGHQVGGLSFAFDNFGNNTSPQTILHQYHPQGSSAAQSPRGRHVATSAPVNVPDWSKIYRVNSVESLHDSDDYCFNEPDLVPPHEYLAAREYASSHKMAAYSVFEGVGRTLKGRDASRVRDAVWSQTGFDG
ncbi:hypothetical protein ABFX02_13G123300 [Erythranthe guttata]